MKIPSSAICYCYDAFSGSSLPVIDGIRYADTYLVEVVDKTKSEYKIKDGTRFINRRAFYGCENLTSISLPKSIERAGEYAFSGCTSLPVIDGIRYADTYLVGPVDKTLSEYKIKDGTKIIGDGAFSGCENLTSIDIPNSVVQIGAGSATDAFYGCPLSTLTIPSSVTYIPVVPSGLTSITCKCVTPPLVDGDYVDYPRNETTLYVPVNTVEAYKSAKLWCDFTTILVDEESYTGIEDVDVAPMNNNAETDKVFDLMGRELKQIPASGIYIKNGKKILVK